MSKAIDYLVTKRDDMLLFALALLISVLLFGQLQSGLTPGKEREFDVPLGFESQSEDITVLQAPRVVRVVASGNQQALDALDTSKVRAIVDLAGARPGVESFRIEVVGPARSGLTLAPVRPNAEVELEVKSRKTFEVQLTTVGTPPENYTYDGVTLLPPVVEVSGPESNVPRVKSVRAVLDLKTISPNQSIELDLEALGEENRPVPLITINPSRVQILPAISIGRSHRVLVVTPVFQGQPAPGYKIEGYSVTPNQVDSIGESGDVSRVTTIDTEQIDISGLRASRTYTVDLVVPDGLTVEIRQVRVTVRVSRN